MIRKIAKKSLVFDKLHKGVVVLCVGVTIYGTAHLGLRWYRYFTLIKPEQKQQELMNNQELLAEGSSERLKDNVATITA